MLTQHSALCYVLGETAIDRLPRVIQDGTLILEVKREHFSRRPCWGWIRKASVGSTSDESMICSRRGSGNVREVKLPYTTGWEKLVLERESKGWYFCLRLTCAHSIGRLPYAGTISSESAHIWEGETGEWLKWSSYSQNIYLYIYFNLIWLCLSSVYVRTHTHRLNQAP